MPKNDKSFDFSLLIILLTLIVLLVTTSNITNNKREAIIEINVHTDYGERWVE